MMADKRGLVLHGKKDDDCVLSNNSSILVLYKLILFSSAFRDWGRRDFCGLSAIFCSC